MTGYIVISPVTAAQPIMGGNAPAAPPMTMFCGVEAFQPDGVDENVKQITRRREARRPAS
jgi:hypothetical protein